MKSLIAILLIATFFSCKNSADKNVEGEIIDTTMNAYDDAISTKEDTIPLEKPIKKDTIRNYKDTQMSEEFFQKAVIDLSDSSLNVYQNIRADYRIFGYQKPDTNSRKMIFFSVFTSDVEGNPYKCPFGAYYYSGAMQDTKIKYIKNAGAFVEAQLITEKDALPNQIYILKDWVTFEERN